MATLVTLDELIVTLRVPADLPDARRGRTPSHLEVEVLPGEAPSEIREACLADPSLTDVRLRLSR